MNKEKDKLINREIGRLTKLFYDIDKNRRLTTKGLIEEAAFMRVTLGELKEEIKNRGVIDEMPQGEYSILREHPAVKTYNTMIQRYSSITKQLTDLLPKEKLEEEEDPFEDFMKMKQK